ncbi:isoamylase 1, chloroplastic-like [Pistacia vera]|uniref:isoamylase 1, chloroplastic-like n=1 Tax=Pistacia vera TaxID=55513 RepID=UPI001262C751|nr:isoamylase 1, chloroplastic-like [Pistacia vera]XP_031281828.1 isoamylase 1, chloroplastic-like [Pistacia vera]
MLYGCKFDGKFSPERGQYYDSSKIVLDPYAKLSLSRGQFGVPAPDDNCWPQMVCMVRNSEDEVFMDVVFNHTTEGNEKGLTLSFRGVDNSVYYMLAPKVLFLTHCSYIYTFT